MNQNNKNNKKGVRDMTQKYSAYLTCVRSPTPHIHKKKTLLLIMSYSTVL